MTMKLDNQQIIDAARRQRDLDTSSMHVKPWPSRHQHFRIPIWLVALPAAAIAGFLFGLFANRSFTDDARLLMAAVDTVYVTHEVLVPQAPDTVIRYVERPRATKKTVMTATEAVTGRSIDQDNIDYTMLVLNIEPHPIP